MAEVFRGEDALAIIDWDEHLALGDDAALRA